MGYRQKSVDPDQPQQINVVDLVVYLDLHCLKFHKDFELYVCFDA